MPIIHHEYPILEYSSQESAVINPRPADAPFPRLCLMTFSVNPWRGWLSNTGAG